MRIVVDDTGQFVPSAARLDRGLGLRLAEHLASTFEIDAGERGTSVALEKVLPEGDEPLEQPDEQQNDDDQCEYASTDVHELTFRSLALGVVPGFASAETAFALPSSRGTSLPQPERRNAMPPRGTKKGTKRARQYEHIKDSLVERGSSEDEAEEIAARTVNKERARNGEAQTSSRLSREDISSGRRGGLRSHRKGPRGRTRDQLYEEAKDRNIRGRSKMTKAELERALGGRSDVAGDSR